MDDNGREARMDKACEIGVPWPLSATKFAVLSSTLDYFYLVDMDENQKEGSCTCEDFRIRKELNDSDFATAPCKHIYRVLIWYAEEGFEAIREIEEKERREEIRRKHKEIRYPVSDEKFYQ